MNLHVHLGGNTGELIFASGAFPAIRAAWPGHRLVLYLHPHFLGVVAGLKHQPDDVRLYPISDPSRPLSSQVTMQLFEVWKAARAGERPTHWLEDGEPHVMLYGMHQPCMRRNDCLPFYRLFQMAGCFPSDGSGSSYEKPGWKTPLVPKYVMAFASGNRDLLNLRSLPVSPEVWDETATAARRRGLVPLTTIHRDDRKVEMPGWEWLETDKPEDVLEALRYSDVTVGLNSGITFSACIVSPGRVTMIDAVQKRAYLFDPMYDDGVLDAARHFQVTYHPESCEDAVRTALRDG